MVTGAARGIGLASALRFAAQGATLVLAGRDVDALQEAAQQARASRADGPAAAAAPVETVVCDVADDAEVKRLFQGVFARHRRLDVLLSNAGVLDDALIGMVSRAQIIDPTTLSGDKIIFGATVTLLDENDKPVRYQIVGQTEADANKGRISYNSPLARALIGKQVGDEIEVTVPAGEKFYLVDRIEFI